MKKFFLSLALTCSFSTAFAMNYNCKHNSGAAPRKLEVKYHSDKKVPCEVVQTRGDVAKTEWDAKNEVGYCEKKAEEELNRLKSQGWKCEELASLNTQAPQEAAPAPAPEQKPVETPAKETVPAPAVETSPAPATN